MSLINYIHTAPNMVTPWAEQVDLSHPWPEYPRPQMVRDTWQNLNGSWEYKITDRYAGIPATFLENIIVPYPLESSLSGVGKHLLPDQRLWYHRAFHVNEDWQGKRVLLHFGAVDWETNVFINHQPVGTHQGGYCPFTIEITDFLVQGDNHLFVGVWDPSDKGLQEHGKQSLKPYYIWYSAVSGIWQTVWLEVVPRDYIQAIKIKPDIDENKALIQVQCNQESPSLTISAEVFKDNLSIGKVKGVPGPFIEFKLENPVLWTPSNPFLYDLKITLYSEGKAIDAVASYFGMRKFNLGKDSDGNTRIMLNNVPFFQLGILDQGYWPDGLYTPPSDEAMLFDIQYLKQSGFNMIRKHVKIEPARYYTHCDRIGMIIWQDMINGGVNPTLRWFVDKNINSRLDDTKAFKSSGRSSLSNRNQFKHELKEMVDTLNNTVSIGVWVLFNEGWGQFEANQITAWLKDMDPSRLVDHASGWFDQGSGDMLSIHQYFTRLKPPNARQQRATVISEFGGYRHLLPLHTWRAKKRFLVYNVYGSKQALLKGYKDLLIEQLLPCVKSGLSASIYTQTTDVEIEVNGLLTYDRRVMKLLPEDIVEVNQEVISQSPK